MDMRTTALCPLLPCLLLALPAAADVPGGHVYVGVGGSWMVPIASDAGGALKPLHKGFALSLELAGETSHALFALGLEYGEGGQAQPAFGLASLRGGLILGSGSTAPYLAAGFGLMHVTTDSNFDCVNGSCIVAEGSGGAAIAEAGVLFFRNLRVGRVAVAARLIEPFFEVRAPGASQGARVPLLLFTLRLLI
jgi:hypothetical protein